jgi:hypothetical protein
MHPFLTRLDVKPEVQAYFAPYYYRDASGDLCFDYGGDFEHFGFAFHRLPAVSNFWMAGNLNFSQVSKVIICPSALEAIAWLQHHWLNFSDTGSLLFLSAGTSLSVEHVSCLREHLPCKHFVLAFGRELLGKLTAIKLAAGIRGQQLHIACLSEEKVQILFRGRNFLFNPDTLSLNVLEKAAGFRFRVTISNPKNFNSFFDQLMAGAGLAF